MEKLSTTSLAKSKNIQPSELFEQLQSCDYIMRKNDSWELTESGKTVGGEMQKSSKYGEYIVWPVDLKIEKNVQKTQISKKLLNATSIGEYFKITSQRLNLILSELGLVEKDVTGWKITKLGKSLGGTEHIHDISGAHYVLWTESILTYSRLIEVFSPTQYSNEQKIQDTKMENVKAGNFRDKYEAKLRTQDGHNVRSKAEVIIDDWLYHSGIVHAYERKLPIGEDMVCDFWIPPGNNRPQGVYIEYWGLENDEKYLERKKKKLELYKDNELPLIELNDEDIQNLDDVLPRKLLNFKIKVY